MNYITDAYNQNPMNTYYVEAYNQANIKWIMGPHNTRLYRPADRGDTAAV